ncbi:O-antigen ligase like membrane protein [Zhouia amylolytica]|uniref:O-antigen ligase like membrane protein n=1 Tax=Zhouia amylolytica TaxID=376730 RepID=A0A1I6VKF2_9FLAO|nr:O-antigen ligase family protein [Zhouia amylolytica]SFT14205.1 O-antigen ligase like membrane protein [Zhouia amylolytica]
MKYILALLLILFASYSDIFLYRIHINPAPPSQLLIPLFLAVFILTYPLKSFIDIVKSHTFKFLLFLFLLSVVYAAFSEASQEILISKISLNLITLLFYSFSLHFFRTENRQTKLIVLVVSFIVLSVSIWFDFLIGLPEYSTKLAESVRKGGFGENPNQAASGVKFLALSILSLIFMQTTKKYLVVALLVATVFITLSRSGIVSVILILILVNINNWNPRFEITLDKLFKSFFKMIFLFSLLYIALLSLSDVIKTNFPAFTRGAAGERLDMILGKSDKGVIEEDTHARGGRGALFIKYLNEFMEEPLGHGTGYTTDQNFNSLNTHNYYLFLAVNLGIIALGAYLFYILFGFRLSLRYDLFFYFIFWTLIFFEGFISHGMLYERPIIICLAFFDSMIYKGINHELNE